MLVANAAISLKMCCCSSGFGSVKIHIHCFHPFPAEIFSSGQVHIWTRRKIVGPDNFSYCCSCCSFLRLYCQKTNKWFFWSLGGDHNGHCGYIHNLCETLSLSLSVSLICIQTQTKHTILFFDPTLFTCIDWALYL